MQLGRSRFLSVRVGSSAELTALRERQVAARDPTRYLAFVLLFVFLLATASGILLLLEYWPGPDRAHDSIVNIMGRVPFGDLVRGVHVWSSQLLVAGLILQVVLYVATRRYTAPRELVWLSLLALLALGVGLAFTGSILPWTQGAYLQARVSSDLASHTPLVGDFLGRLLRGGREVDSWTLHHAFAFHVGVLPAATTLAIAAHAGLYRRAQRAISDKPGPRHCIPIYPDFVVRVAAACVFVLGATITLATLVSVPLGAAADVGVAVTNRARPPWYFLFVHQLLEAAPPRLLGVESADFVMAVLTLVLVLVAALPFIDRRGSRVTWWAGTILLALYLGLTAYASV